MSRSVPASPRRRLARPAGRQVGALAGACAVLALLLLAPPSGSTPTVVVSEAIDAHLCSFPLEVTLHSGLERIGGIGLWLSGPGTLTLRNETTGRTTTLAERGGFTIGADGTVRFQGDRLWAQATGAHVPFLATSGAGTLTSPAFVLSGGGSARVVDPCALLASSPLSTRPRTTDAPWGLPADQLGQIAYAGLTPVVGGLVRHDHVHLDLVVDGHKVTVPAGVGLAEPVDRGVCPPGPKFGDCATGHFYTAQVAVSPIHTHSTSGLIHIESDRPGRFTLGEFFDEWGVRLSASCVGGYCNGGGRALRVYVNGKRYAGNPRAVVLTNMQEIAVVYGGPTAFASVPTRYTGGWPGLGCGGKGEISCLPPKSG